MVGHQQPRFTATGFVLVRAPALPRASAPPPPGGVSDVHLRRYVRDLVGRPELLDAVRLASPSLSEAAERSDSASGSRLVRLATGLTGYALRMSHRPTPSGLFAGIAIGTIGDSARVRVGVRHHHHARPDASWLLSVAARLEREPDLLARARLVADATVHERGDHLVLPRRGVETVVQATEPIRTLLRTASAPIGFARLLEEAANALPDSPTRFLPELIGRLVTLGFLHSDLTPTSEVDDGLGHVLDRLAHRPDHPANPVLRHIRSGLREYEAAIPSRRAAIFDRVSATMRSLQAADRPIRVDLRLDAEVRLPHGVVDEAARAVEAIWRMSGPARRSPLAAYHRRFFHRYGPRRVVPLAELLGATGLGPITGRNRAPATPLPGRRRLLAEYVHAAVAEGAREIVLDQAAVARLANQDRDVDAPAEVELYAVLRAASPSHLDAGDFRLVLGRSLGTRRLGASFGRFSALLGQAAGPVREAVRAAYTDGAVRHAVLVCRTAGEEAANCGAAPDWMDRHIRVGVGPGLRGGGELPLSALGVTATEHRLRLVTLDDGRDVVPIRFDLLHPGALESPVARLLDELATGYRGELTGWDWAGLDEAPFLPRIRLGRTVLSSARWNLSPALTGPAADAASWADRFARWREAVRLPDAALLRTADDQYIPVNLTDPLHLRMLRQQVARTAGACLLELPGGEDCPDGWFTGPDGAHTVELVIPLTGPRPAPPEPVSVRGAPPRSDRLVLPGGSWLSARLYVPRSTELIVLREHLPGLLDALLGPLHVDAWHFVRFADPASHLRLRFRSTDERLWSAGLSAVRDWTEMLRRRGLAGELLLDGYEPEIERYGGLHAIAAAERVFTADSLTVLDELRSAPVGAEPLLVAAAGIVDLVRSLGDPELTAAWSARPVSAAGRAVFTSMRRSAVALVDPADDFASIRALPAGDALVASWTRRRSALAELGRRLHLTERPAGVAASLVHLHCNRLLGLDTEAEHAAVAIARGAMRAHADRARHHQPST
ncbi:lantibiotic dehydratase [Asanoa ishikariensis]|uniref:Thiopeptide-type bacteriocin biosynthesis domain-containing protein n=1 Tax=Asanoa ishikariensis TaxID=137265 RepID=A0A1H3U8W9_9ACTN|nr:lantibiotic dehydratase [Asanoa ishikariensis]GIF64115.1 lantibiotic dehydratase [Asanoa ishikariensis]SDZ58531.1 thiopeptide-type bacteriocin biosynthesis domain-containing protein [Asanoa ishikariensis]